MYCRPCPRFRGAFVVKAHRLLYHSTLGLRVIKKRKKKTLSTERGSDSAFCRTVWWWFRIVRYNDIGRYKDKTAKTFDIGPCNVE